MCQCEKLYGACDGTDFNTDGFNYDWSTHDKTVCQNIYIKNNTFKNIGTAVGSHTYSADGSTQLYHQNVQITNNTFDGTYNAAIRALNWKDVVIQVSASVPGAVKAGYGDTICQISDINWSALQANTLTNVAAKYRYIVVRSNEDQMDSAAEKKPFLE